MENIDLLTPSCNYQTKGQPPNQSDFMKIEQETLPNWILAVFK